MEMSRGHIFYDAIHKRERTIEEFQLGKNESKFDILRLHNEGVEYAFDLLTKNCTKYGIRREWRDFGIPSDAKSVGEGCIGSCRVERAGLLVTQWEDEFKNREGEAMYWFGEWTYEACLPVKLELYKKESKDEKSIHSHDMFADITPGVAAEAFLVRKECANL